MKKGFILFCLWFSFSLYLHPQTIHKTRSPYVSLIPITALVAYAGMWAYTLSHEFGHAVVAKMFERSNQIDIHIGQAHTNGKPMFKMGPVSVDSLCPMKGYAALKKLPSEKWKNVLIDIAGGITGGLQSYLLFVGLAAFHHFKQNDNLSQACTWGFKNTFSPFKNICDNKRLSQPKKNCFAALTALALILNLRVAAHSFFPNNHSLLNITPKIDFTDGTKAWIRLSNGSPKIPITAYLMSYVTEWILRFIIIKKAWDCVKNNKKILYKPTEQQAPALSTPS